MEICVFRLAWSPSLDADSTVFLGALVDLGLETAFLSEVICFEDFASAGFLVTALPPLVADDGAVSELLVDLGAEAAASEERVDLIEGTVASTDFLCRLS